MVREDAVAKTYRPRVADDQIAERLTRQGAVLVEGVKGCGKTATARRQAASEVRFDLDDDAREMALIDPLRVLRGATPRLLDEWQLAPRIWNAVRREVDDRPGRGQFILTGSATPADDLTRHSGAGRFSRLRMRPMSLFESGYSSGEVSLADLLGGAPVEGQSPIELDDVIEQICHGGWPADVGASLRVAARNMADYVNELTHAEIKSVDGVRRDPVRVRNVMASLARNISGTATLTTIAADVSGGGSDDADDRANVTITDETVADYLRALERLMIYEPVPAWEPALRSKTRLRTARVHQFADPAIATTLLGAGPDELDLDPKTLGLLFESLAMRDLRVYASANYADVYRYKDATELEVDAIIYAGVERWIGAEIKLGGAAKVINKAAANLLKFAERIDTQSTGEPAALVVITATGYAYRRPDGVTVVPLGTLKP
jgi:predicted AAA+ superfamily ATPase